MSETAAEGPWKPKQYEPNRAEKCACPYGDYIHAALWDKADGWCALCGQKGISEPAIWYALNESIAHVEQAETQLAEAVEALANIAGAAAARSADTRLPAEARDSFGWIDGRARAALEPHE